MNVYLGGLAQETLKSRRVLSLLESQFMFGLGWLEVSIILIVALLVFGPKKIPEMGSAIGKTLRGFKDELNGSDTEPKDDYDE